MRILWVESNKYITNSLLKHFSMKHKIEYVRIYDPDDFINNYIVKLNNNDIILLAILFDINGKRDKTGFGFKILENIKNNKKNIPIIIFTVLSYEVVKEHTRNYENIVEILRKPVTFEELEEAILAAFHFINRT